MEGGEKKSFAGGSIVEEKKETGTIYSIQGGSHAAFGQRKSLGEPFPNKKLRLDGSSNRKGGKARHVWVAKPLSEFVSHRGEKAYGAPPGEGEGGVTKEQRFVLRGGI